jgi:hypothetical protein
MATNHDERLGAPDFVGLSRIEETLLVAKLEAIRSSITHAAEKGRALERAVCGLLRDLLPAEYGLSTGFVVWLSPSGPQLSRQLDIIIYDAIRSGPLIRLDTCDVFPLEAVYGYVEVKATLRSSDALEPPHDSIEACVARNLELRQMNVRSFYIPEGGSPSSLQLTRVGWLSLRSFIVAFEADGTSANSLSTLSKRMGAALKKAGVPAHLHGVLIPNHGLLSTRPVDRRIAAPEDYFHVRSVGDHALLQFKTLLLQHLATFQRPAEGWVTAVDQYFAQVADWHESLPESE